MEALTRRDCLKRTALGAAALGTGSFLAACGGSTATGAQSAVASGVGAPRRGGTLRLALTGGASTDTADPLLAVNAGDFARMAALFNTLVKVGPTGAPEYVLAEEITPNPSGTVWTVRLKPGIEFHNGKSLGADDVIYTYRTVLSPKSPTNSAPAFSTLDVAGMRKLDKYTVRMPFTAPFATFIEELATPGFSPIIPTGFDAHAPIGTGPFKLTRLAPGQETVMARNENYWEKGLPYLDQVVMTNFSDEVSQINALVGGQADAANNLSADSVNQVTGAGKKVLISNGGGMNPFTMRVDEPPFNDVRVRQAMRLVIDRPQMLNTVYGGHGLIGNDVSSIFDPAYDHSMPQRSQDIEQAKSLLRQAGRSDLTVQLVTSDIAQGTIQSAQVLAQQAAAAGIKINVRQVTVTDFFGPNYLKWLFSQDYYYYTLYFSQVSESLAPKSPFNETHWSNPRYGQLYGEALATVDNAKRTQIAHEMQRIDYDEGGYIVPYFAPVIDGYAPKVGGLLPSKSGVPLNGYNFAVVWLT